MFLIMLFQYQYQFLHECNGNYSCMVGEGVVVVQQADNSNSSVRDSKKICKSKVETEVFENSNLMQIIAGYM